MTSIAHQTDEELGGRASVLVRQRRDHVELDRLLSRLVTTRGAEQDEVLTRVNRLVFTHAFAEESVLFPAVRRLPQGQALTLGTEQAHQQIDEVVRLLDRTGDGPERQELVRRYVDLLRQDVRSEEDDILPALQAALSRGAQRRLGLVWELVRRTAPTRPHPVVSRRPPGNVLSALPLTVIDRTRDRLDRAARSTAAPAGRRLSGASRGLGRVADAVERLAPLQRGEHASTAVSAPAGSTGGGRGSGA